MAIENLGTQCLSNVTHSEALSGRAHGVGQMLCINARSVSSIANTVTLILY